MDYLSLVTSRNELKVQGPSDGYKLFLLCFSIPPPFFHCYKYSVMYKLVCMYLCLNTEFEKTMKQTCL